MGKHGVIWENMDNKESIENIAKGTTDPRVEFMSQVITQILIKQFQNFD